MIKQEKVEAIARFLMLSVLLLPFLLIASLFVGCGGAVTEEPITSEPPQEAEAASPSPEESALKPEAKTVSLKILSHSSYVRYGSYVSWPSGKRYKGNFYHVVGELQNPASGSVRLDEDKIEATLYDALGSIIDADFVLKYKFAEEEVLAPGEKWPFRVVLLDEDASKRVANYELVAKGGETTEVPQRVEVPSYGLFQNANLELIGEVKNTTDENIEVSVIATFYDEEGTVMAADEFWLLVGVLGPGEKAPFSLLPVPREAPGEVEACEVTTRWSISDKAPYREFEILDVIYQEGPEWSWKHHTITGEVRNSGKQSVDSVWVYATYYDAKGKVIDWGISEVEPSSLNPGDKGSFELIAPPPPWEMPNYALLVKGTLLAKQ